MLKINAPFRNLILVMVFSFGSSGLVNSSNYRGSQPGSECRDRIDIEAALRNLASSKDGEAQEARRSLYDHAKKSPRCRATLVSKLMRAMDRPNLNFDTDDSNYYLWREGARLLGDLRATEALDLLISHLDLRFGITFSASMDQQPAIIGISRIGSSATPKLTYALMHNTNRNIRVAAAFCLSGISGTAAIGALNASLRSELDPCVTRFVRLALDLRSKEIKVARGLASPSEREALKKLQIDRMLGLSCGS